MSVHNPLTEIWLFRTKHNEIIPEVTFEEAERMRDHWIAEDPSPIVKFVPDELLQAALKEIEKLKQQNKNNEDYIKNGIPNFGDFG